MSVARVTKISASSPTSFEDALQVGIARAAKTLKNVEVPLDPGAEGGGEERRRLRVPGQPEGDIRARGLSGDCPAASS